MHVVKRHAHSYDPVEIRREYNRRPSASLRSCQSHFLLLLFIKTASQEQTGEMDPAARNETIKQCLDTEPHSSLKI